MDVADQKKNRPQRRNPHISMEEREYAYWVLTLDPIEREILHQSMDAADWRELGYLIFEIKDEIISDWMEENGYPDAEMMWQYMQKRG